MIQSLNWRISNYPISIGIISSHYNFIIKDRSFTSQQKAGKFLLQLNIHRPPSVSFIHWPVFYSYQEYSQRLFHIPPRLSSYPSILFVLSISRPFRYTLFKFKTKLFCLPFSGHLQCGIIYLKMRCS